MKQGRFKDIGLSIFLIVAGVLIASCLDSEPDKYICILNCNPSECLELDEENCACISDLDCVTEKFCGGDIEECGCKQEDGGSWCTALTDDSIKTWKFAYVYDSIRDTTYTSVFEFFYGDLKNLNYTYRLDNIYLEWAPDNEPHVYSWEFDNVHQPTTIKYAFIDAPGNYNNPLYNQDFNNQLLHLTTDTLKFGYKDGSTEGEIVFVPENS